MSQNNKETEVQRFAANIVQTVVTKVKEEIYPGYQGSLDDEDVVAENDIHMEMYKQTDSDQSASDDEELAMAARNIETRNRSVQFNVNEAIIPLKLDSLDVNAMKPVSEHILTPVPSPLPVSEGYDFDYSEKPEEPELSGAENVLVEVVLLHLVEEIDQGRIIHEDLLMLTGCCMELLRDDDSEVELYRDSSARVADDLVRFALEKIFEDVTSGRLRQEDLTTITQSIVKDAFREDAAPDDDKKEDDDQQQQQQHISEWMLDDSVTSTLGQVKKDMLGKKLSEDAVMAIGSAVVNAVPDDVSTVHESLTSEGFMRETLQQILEDIQTHNMSSSVMDKAVSALVSSYSRNIASGASLFPVPSASAAPTARALSSQLVKIVSSVLQGFMIGLKRGEVSREAVAVYMGGICPNQDVVNMDVEGLCEEIQRVVADVEANTTSAVYIHAIADSFIAVKDHTDEKTPELVAIGNVFSTVDASLLGKFVQVTLLSALLGFPEPNLITSVVSLESSVIVRKVINDVILRVGSEFAKGKLDIDEITSQRRSADRARGDSPSSDFSMHVLRALSTVVSDLPTSMGTTTESVQRGSSASNASSSVIAVHIYAQIQSAVTRLQNTSSDGFARTQARPTEYKHIAKGDTPGCITDVLKSVVREIIMDREILNSKREHDDTVTSASKIYLSKETNVTNQIASSEVAMLVLITIKRALDSLNDEPFNDSQTSNTETSFRENKLAAHSASEFAVPEAIHPKLLQEVAMSMRTTGTNYHVLRDLAAEVVNRTLSDLRENRLTQVDLASLANAIPGEGSTERNDKLFVLNVLECTKRDITSGVVKIDCVETVVKMIAGRARDSAVAIVKKCSSRSRMDIERGNKARLVFRDVIAHLVVTLPQAEKVKDETADAKPKIHGILHSANSQDKNSSHHSSAYKKLSSRSQTLPETEGNRTDFGECQRNSNQKGCTKPSMQTAVSVDKTSYNQQPATSHTSVKTSVNFTACSTPSIQVDDCDSGSTDSTSTTSSGTTSTQDSKRAGFEGRTRAASDFTGSTIDQRPRDRTGGSLGDTRQVVSDHGSRKPEIRLSKSLPGESNE